MPKQVMPIYQGKQNNMCDAVILGWENNKLKLKAFSDKDATYTEKYADDAIKEANEAKSMPDVSKRRAVPVSNKAIMKPVADIGIGNYLIIIGFIEKLWPHGEVEATKNLAGYAKYPTAAAYNWSDLDSILKSGAEFMADNIDRLTTGGMNPSFPAQYAEMQAQYNNLFTLYYQSKQGVKIATTGKREKLNAVYSRFMLMSGDSKKFFRQDKDMMDLFTYDKLYEQVAGSKQSGYHITLRSEGDLLPVTTSTITFQPGNKSFYASEHGIIEARLREGTYTYTITTPGYHPLTGTLIVNKKVMHRIELILQKNIAVA